jgi:feruloyl-CoA synthase
VLILFSEPPSIDHNEIADKGHIDQRAGLPCWSAAAEHLYVNPVADDVRIIPR